MVLPSLNKEEQATKEEDVRHLRSRDVIIRNQERGGRAEDRNREHVEARQGSQRADSSHVRPGSQLGNQGENTVPLQLGVEESVERRSVLSRSSRRSELQATLEDIEAEMTHRRHLHELERQAEESERERQRQAEESERERQRQAEESEQRRQRDELQQQYELERVRRELGRASSRTGSQVSGVPSIRSLPSVGVMSPRQRTASWVDLAQNSPNLEARNIYPPELSALPPRVKQTTRSGIGNDAMRADSFPTYPEHHGLSRPKPRDNNNNNTVHPVHFPHGVNRAENSGWESYFARKAAGKCLPTFNGDPTEWLNFISAFRRTTESCNFSNEENMSRLDKALAGKARESVKSLLAVPNAVEEIVRMLELQFGRPIIILNNLTDKVRKFPRLSDDNPQAVVDFSVRVNNLVVAIECLGRFQYLSNPQLLDEIVAKLSPTFRQQWGEFAVTELKGEADLVSMKEWLYSKALGAAYVATTSVPRGLPRPEGRQVNIINEDKSVITTTDGKELSCYYCKEKHSVRECKQFRDLSVDKRKSWVKDNKLCFSCLSSQHRIAKCRNTRKCGMDGCKGSHHNLLHSTKEERVPESVNVVSQRTHSRVFLMVLPVRVRGPKGECVVSALLDEGAHCSLIDMDLANDLGLSGHRDPLCLHWVQEGVEGEDPDSETVSLSVSGVEPSSRSYTLGRVRTFQKLSLPHQSVDREELRKIWPGTSHIPIKENLGSPKLLIGEDNWSIIEPLKRIRQSWNGLALSKTRLGWVLHGQFRSGAGDKDDSVLHVCHVKDNDDALHRIVKDNFSLELLGTTGNECGLSRDELRAESILNNTARLSDGRWEVGLLWKSDQDTFVDSFPTAIRRLFCVERKMDRDPQLAEQYCRKINDYVAKGYARKLVASELNEKPARLWYLPHLAVFNPNKPGKIRVVFDASAEVNGVSLNKRLLKGPDLYNSIPEILMQFRKGRVGFAGDIKEMYLRIRIREEDQVAQRFLWRGMNRNQKPDHFVMESMLFGAICSPFQAQEIRNRNALSYQMTHPKAVEAIRKKHYMDDYLDSADSEEEAIQIIRDVLKIHHAGSFQMVNWVSNSQRVLTEVEPLISESMDVQFDSDHTEKVLGLRWNPSKDVFVFQLNRNRIPGDILSGRRGPTKREFLRIVMSIFDPLGFLGWYLINVKILLQEIWRSKIGWDEEIEDDHRSRWNSWLHNLSSIETLEIPRHYSSLLPVVSAVELHVFCDASDRAYAALAYVRVVLNDQVAISLIATKSRVAPLKQVSVPRLELQAAVLGCRLAHAVRKGCNFGFQREFFWTDSRTVLHWIAHSEVRYRMFIAHRVGEIVETTDINQWCWVPGSENPADDATKWQTSMSERWLWGPMFLKYSEERWPQGGDIFPDKVGELEVLEQLNLVVLDKSTATGLPDISRFSNFLRLIRSTAWLLRFVRRCREKSRLAEKLILTPSEIDKAEETWWRQLQSQDFHQEIFDLQRAPVVSRRSKLYRISPFLDDSGVLRVRGRIDRVQGVTEDMKHPVILQSRNPFVKLLIDYFHRKALHQGQEFVANELRQRYWILGLRRAVRSSWHRCLKCARERNKPFEQPMAPLPYDRLQHGSRPFTNVGLDYFGPLFVTVKRTKEKRYGAIFSCLTTRAVHLELVNDLTTDGTLLAVRRMISRRGCPSRIWSDNGTNFRGADKVIRSCLNRLNQESIREKLASRGIEWNFLPPVTPHMGGSWERLIRSVKKALMATMKSSAPQEDVLTTLLIEAEALVNSRPLTTVSEDPADPEALTPNHFLIGSSSGATSWHAGNEKLHLRKRWVLAQHLADHFWRRWLREYLPGLVRKTKWYGKGNPIEVGQLVYLVDPKRPRGEWRPARIVATFPGRDGLTRVVDVKTSEGIKRRSITSLLPLLHNEE